YEKGEESAEKQEDNDENVGERRRKIGAQFAFGDSFDIRPGVHFFSSVMVSGMVMLRNTSSSLPSSVCSSSMCQPCAASAMLRARLPLASGDLGNTRAVTRVASSLRMAVRLTVDSTVSFEFKAEALMPVTRTVTAPAHSD